MPTGIAGIVRMGKTHREAAKVRAATPAPSSNQLVESGVKHRRALRLHERLLHVTAEPDDRFRPGRRIMRITSGIRPHDLTGLVDEFSGESPVDPDKTVLNELFDLRVAEGAHAFGFMSRHEKSSYRSAKAIRPRIAGPAGSSGPWEMLPAVRPWAHSSSSRQRRRRQRLRKKTDAILRVRIIMMDQLYTAQCRIGNGDATRSYCVKTCLSAPPERPDPQCSHETTLFPRHCEEPLRRSNPSNPARGAGLLRCARNDAFKQLISLGTLSIGPDERRGTRSSRKIARVAAPHGVARGDLGIEGVEILGAVDAAQRIAAGRDQVALAGRIEA